MNNGRIPMRILPFLPHTQDTPPPLPLSRLVLLPRTAHTLFLFLARIMIIMHQDILSIFILASLPHTQYTASPRLSSRRDKILLFWRRGDKVHVVGGRNLFDLAEDAGTTAFAVGPGVLLVGHDAPILFVLRV
jgi:hypothetical protein